MKIVAALVLIAFVALVVAPTAVRQPRSGSWVEPDDAEVAAAEAQAKASLPEFLRRMEQPGPGETDFMLKFRAAVAAKRNRSGRRKSPSEMGKSTGVSETGRSPPVTSRVRR